MQSSHFKNVKKVLCLGAHADDIEIGCGGTVLKLAREYPELNVCWVVFSAEGHRAREARTSAQVFLKGIHKKQIVLERFKMRVVSAENGKDAIRLLMEQPDTDIVLMDIMLPTMDGYTTIRAIREIEQFKSLPIVAVTAKAMKGDREKCIAAGASDYLCKPVEAEQLRLTMRVWLHR